jgi:hypothetical protein
MTEFTDAARVPAGRTFTRRTALALGGGVAGALVTGGAPAVATSGSGASTGSLPVKQIEAILQMDGTVSSGVLDVSVARDDIGNVRGPRGVVFTPDFEIHGDLYFQPLSGGRALLNGDMALKPSELQDFIDALLSHGLTWQAFHQHLPELNPMVWFMHFRGVGDPLELARSIHAAIKVTSTPLPQHSPAHPTTSLDAARLARILHGDAQVGGGGVVSVTVPRTDSTTLAGVRLSPETGISTTIEFKPRSGSGCDAVPDFSLISSEVVPVARMMRSMDWYNGCLYNQETAEHPQHYFSHQLKTGDAYQLAREIRRGLDLTRSA